MFFRQCFLEKSLPTGTKCTMSWLPEQFAKPGKYLKLMVVAGTWEDGWKVVALGARRGCEEVQTRSRDHLTHRRGSDI